MEINSPKQITVPKGPQSGDRLRIMGITPTAAAAEVKKIGRILRFRQLMQHLLRCSDVFHEVLLHSLSE